MNLVKNPIINKLIYLRINLVHRYVRLGTKLFKTKLKLNKELKMNTVLCAFVKTIGVLVGIVLFICCFFWINKNISSHTIGMFLLGTIFFIFFCMISVIVANLFLCMYQSCEVSNQKKTEIKVNQTIKKTKSVQSNKEPVNQKTASTEFDMKPTKQYPVLGEIQKIISHLSELETNQDLDKDIFVEFHVLKDNFNSDYQEIVKMLNTLEEIDQFDDNYLESFNHYLDVFKKQQQIIYSNLKQQYNNKLNAINEQLQNLN